MRLTELGNALPAEVRRHFTEGAIPPTTWRHVVSALKTARPPTAATLERLEAIIGRRQPLAGQGAEITTLERDAVLAALGMAGMDRNLFRESAPSLEPIPFIERLSGQHVIEDQLLQHDLTHFGDWRSFDAGVAAAFEFRDGRGRRLVVMNVNRTRIEATLGVDLLYYSVQHDSYTLVQYKMLRKRTDHGDYEYSLSSDQSLTRELNRMREIPMSNTAAAEPNQYRLDARGVYLKFCKNVQQVPLGNGVISGFYFPLEFFSLMENSDVFLGPKGGRILRSKRLPRYLSTTQFSDLVASGWIGTRSTASEKVTEIVRELLADRHSVILAASSPDGSATSG